MTPEAKQRLDDLRARLRGDAGRASQQAVRKLQTEMAGELFWLSDRLEDGDLTMEEIRQTLPELKHLRDNLNSAIEVLESVVKP